MKYSQSLVFTLVQYFRVVTTVKQLDGQGNADDGKDFTFNGVTINDSVINYTTGDEATGLNNPVELAKAGCEFFWFSVRSQGKGKVFNNANVDRTLQSSLGSGLGTHGLLCTDVHILCKLKPVADAEAGTDQ